MSKRLIIDEDELLGILRQVADRHVYRINNTNRWAITSYRNAEVSIELLQHLIRIGKLRQAYSNTLDAYGLGPTLDIEATQAYRRKTGDSRHLVYL